MDPANFVCCYLQCYVSNTDTAVGCWCASDGSTNSATALRGSYGRAMIHEVSDYYDSSPFVSRSTPDHTLADVTSRTNNAQTQSSEAAATGRKGYSSVLFQ